MSGIIHSTKPNVALPQQENIDTINFTLSFTTKPVQDDGDSVQISHGIDGAGERQIGVLGGNQQNAGPGLVFDKNMLAPEERDEISIPADLKRQLDSLMVRATEENYGNITNVDIQGALNNPAIHLSNEQQQALTVAHQEMENAMAAFHDLKGEQLIEAYRINDADILAKVDNAMEAQRHLAETIRSLKNGNEAFCAALERLADRCDMRASEILSAVFNVINPPGVEDLLQEMGKMPSCLSGLKNEMAHCRISKSLQQDVMRKMEVVQQALSRLGSSNALEISHELEIGDDTHVFEEACDALQSLADAIHGLHTKRRASEALENIAFGVEKQIANLMMLGNQLPELLENSKSKNMENVLMQVIPEMHGTTAVLTRFQEDLNPILEKLDDFERNPQSTHSLDELCGMRHKLDLMRCGLQKIIRTGAIVLKDGSKTILDSTTLDSMRKLLEKSSGCLEKFCSYFINHPNHLETASRETFPTLDISLSISESELLKNEFPIISKLAYFSSTYRGLEVVAQIERQLATTKLKQLNQELRHELDSMKGGLTREIVKLKRLLQNLELLSHQEPIPNDYERKMAEQLREIVLSHPSAKDEIADGIIPNLQNFFKFFALRKPELDYKLRRLEALYENNQQEPEIFKSVRQGSIIRKAMDESIPLATLVESRLNGASPDMIDDLCDDIYLTAEPEALGHGSINTVYLCSYQKPGGEVTQKVFKAEYESSMGVLNMLMSFTGATSLQNAHMNISSQKVAKLLHCENIMPKTSVGMLKNKYGIFMDLAKGFSPKQLRLDPDDVDIRAEGSLSHYEIKNLTAEQKAKVRWQMMKECNKLQWNDLLMAQGDRHGGNYVVDIDRDLNVKLTAIDNDACLFEWVDGVKTLTIPPEYSEVLDRRALPMNGMERDSFINTLQAKGAIVSMSEDDGICIQVDKLTAKEKKILHDTLDFKAFKVPDFMDENVYEGLMDLEQNPQAFAQALPPDLTTRARSAAVNRLREMISLAHEYKRDGKVLDSNSWQNPQKQLEIQQNYESTMIEPNTGAVDYDSRIYNSDIYYRDLARFFS